MPNEKKSLKKVQKPETKKQIEVKPNKEDKKPAKKIATREIDATGKVLGRLATEVAVILRGKDKPAFRPNLLMGDKVVVTNAKKMIITGRKIEQKVYQCHTGYLGHLKTTIMKELMEKDPAEVLRRAVYGMLPKNKLRPDWMKNLEIKND